MNAALNKYIVINITSKFINKYSLMCPNDTLIKGQLKSV